MKASVVFLFIAVITSSTAAPLLFISTLKNCLNEIFQEKTTTVANRIDTFTPLPQLETPDENIEFTSTVLREVEELFEEKHLAFTTIAPLDLGVETEDLPSVIFREVNERLVKKEIAAPITTSTTTTTTTAVPNEIELETEEPAKTTDEKKYTIPELIASKVKERVVSSKITKAVVNNKVSKGLIYLTPMFLQKTLYLDKLISEVNRIDSSPITTASPIEMDAETEAAEPALEKEYTIPELIAFEVKDRVVSSKITKAVVNNKVSKGLIYLTPTFLQKKLYLDKLVSEVNKN